VQRAECLGLAAKPRDRIGLAREVRVQHLERDRAAIDHVRRAIDRAEAARGESELDAIAPIDDRTDERIDDRHLRAVWIGLVGCGQATRI